LETATRLAADAFKRANEVYDEALTLFANVSALTAPEINLDKLKQDSVKAIEEAQRLQEEINSLVKDHEKLVENYGENSDLGKVLVQRSQVQQDEAVKLLEHLSYIHTTAKEAVALGDGTLKEANNTYNTLAGFQAQVETSSEGAKLALQTVPEIEKQIRDADETVQGAEDALSGAHYNAEEARKNAQEAQEKYAEQASKDSETIRRKANDTKTSAHKLRGEADHLNGRVVVTENRILKLEGLGKKDDVLTDEAKEKVGQAQSDSSESKNQVEKAINEVNAIMAELASLRDINVNDLDVLEKRLTAAEEEVRRANLSERLENLAELKSLQSQWIRNYQSEIVQLESEVANIRLIADALPPGCFKRQRLEP